MPKGSMGEEKGHGQKRIAVELGLYCTLSSYTGHRAPLSFLLEGLLFIIDVKASVDA